MRRYNPWLYLILGFIFVLFPVASSTLICRVVGMLALFLGGYRLYQDYQLHQIDTDLISSAGLFLFGLICLVAPTAILSIIPIVLGSIITIDGVGKLGRSWKIREVTYMPFIFALLLTILGVLLLLDPFGAVINLFTLLGIILIFDGIVELLVWTKYI